MYTCKHIRFTAIISWRGGWGVLLLLYRGVSHNVFIWCPYPNMAFFKTITHFYKIFFTLIPRVL